jgi:peptide/nickel transport system substrate-binding protein
VVFDFKFSNWHNGEKMDMKDILHSLYFTTEWGTQTDENDKTFDTEFTPRAAQSIDTIIGVNPIDEDTLEVYVDYWHFDENEIADWAILWNSMPWEISVAMEKAVIDGKVSFSRSGATSKNVNWLSLIIPNDAKIIKEYLQEFKENNFIPEALNENNQNLKYYQNRYDSSIKWIEENNHAVISNGPFYLKAYSPESRTITVNAFDDDSYPFKIGEWEKFENTEFPIIKKIDSEKVIQKGNDFKIGIETENADRILYFITNSEGEEISSETIKIENDGAFINLPIEKTQHFGIGANNIKIFAISDTVLKPDFYESSFMVTEEKTTLPTSSIESVEFSENRSDYSIFIIPLVVIIGIVIYLKKRQS